MDWEAERKRIEDAANTVRNLLDGTRLQVRDLESEMLRLEGEYRLVSRMAEALLAARQAEQQEVKTNAKDGDGDPSDGRSPAMLDAF